MQRLQEVLRDNCSNLRDRARIDLPLSTGIRVGELVRLNIEELGMGFYKPQIIKI